MHNCAYMYENRIGTTINSEEAIKYYKLTADNGDIKSMLDCGRILSQRNGILVDKKESAKNYKMSS